MAEASRTELTNDTVYDILSNRRRRFVVHALKRENGAIKTPKLSTYVAAWELDVEPQQVPPDKRRSVHTTLRRTHLPKLSRNGIVTVDEERNRVEPAPKLDELEVYTQVVRDRGIPWSHYYIGICLVSVLIVVARQTGIPVFVELTPLQVSTLITGIFVAVSVGHYVYSKRHRLGTHKRPPEVRQTD